MICCQRSRSNRNNNELVDPDDSDGSKECKLDNIAEILIEKVVDTFNDPLSELSLYHMPPLGFLNSEIVNIDENELAENIRNIQDVLKSNKIKIGEIKGTKSTLITLYEITLGLGTHIKQIQNLTDEFTLALKARDVKIAPIFQNGTVGIYVPNKFPQNLNLSEVINSSKFVDIENVLPIAMGKTIFNKTVILDLDKLQHILLAGAPETAF